MSWMGPVLVLLGALTNLGTAYVVLRAHNRVLARGREASARAAAHANAAEVSAVAAGAIYAQLVVESDPCCDDHHDE